MAENADLSDRSFMCTFETVLGTMSIIFSWQGVHVLHSVERAALLSTRISKLDHGNEPVEISVKELADMAGPGESVLLSLRDCEAEYAAKSRDGRCAVHTEKLQTVAARAAGAVSLIEDMGRGRKYSTACSFASELYALQLPLCPEKLVSPTSAAVLHALVRFSRCCPRQTLTYKELARLVNSKAQEYGCIVSPGLDMVTGNRAVHGLESEPANTVPVHHRAVAMALKNNPVLLLIPCHMVVPSGSSFNPGGFVLGTSAKEKLLRFWQADICSSSLL